MFDLKKQLRWAEIKSGIIVTVALAILFFSVFFSGSIEKLLYPKVEIKAAVANAKGLKTGAPVWVSGIEEGSVKKITLDPVYGTVMTIAIDKKVMRFLKKDSTANILTMGLLGDKYVEIGNGTAAAGPLQAGDMIKATPSLDIKDVMETGAGSIQKVTEFIDKMGNLVDKIGKSKGSFSMFLEDPALYNNLTETTRSLSAITRDINGGKGTIGLLVRDPSVFERLSAASKSLEHFGKKLETGSGSFNKLFEDDMLYNRLTGAAASIEEFGKKINSPSGTLGKLTTDSELYDNLTNVSRRLSAILESIERGEGTAGALIKDEEMAQDLKQTVKDLKELTEDIKKQPRKYFKFSVF